MKNSRLHTSTHGKHLIQIVLIIGILFTGCQRDELVLPEVKKDLTDQQPPSLVIQYPSTNVSITLDDDYTNISGIADDNGVLQSIAYISDTRSGEVNGLESWLISDLPLIYGDNTIIVTATDSASNTKKDSIIITRNRYLTFMNAPAANPSDLYVNTTTRVKFSISIAPVANLVKGSVKIVEVDETFNVLKELTVLYDDGDINHSDQVKDDWIYSGHYDFKENTPRKLLLRVTAETDENGTAEQAMSAIIELGVYDKVSSGTYQELANFFDAVYGKHVEAWSGLESATILDSLETWLSAYPGIYSVERITTGLVCEFDNGITAGIKLSEKSQDGYMSYKGASSPLQHKKAANPGNLFMGESYTNKKSSEQNFIANRNILLWAPDEEDFPVNAGPSLKSLLSGTKVPFNLTYLKNTDCTAAAILDMTEYGLVIIDAHGIQGKYFSTGEDFTAQTADQNSLLLKSKRLSVWANIIFNQKGELEEFRTRYYLNDNFVSALPGIFPNALIVNGSCESTSHPDLKEAFFGKGSATYLGFSDLVTPYFCDNVVTNLLEGILVDNLVLSDVFISRQSDNTAPNAEFELFGSKEILFPVELINGDFEDPVLPGWDKIGDVRVVSDLGSIQPVEGQSMGLLTTGIETYLDKSAIEQQFYIGEEASDLIMEWTFLSEEFMEWVDAEKQDKLVITLIDEDDNEHILLSNDITTFNQEYSMLAVSPEIEFDQGDVYSTGWQTGIFDVSRFAGTAVTLRIELVDSGDGIFDSALLLDHVRIR